MPDVDAACKRFEALGVEFIKKPEDGEFRFESLPTKHGLE